MLPRPRSRSQSSFDAGLLLSTTPTSSPGLKVLQSLASDERAENVLAQVPGLEGPQVLRVLKVQVAPEPFLSRTRALQAAGHPSLRSIRATGQMKDGRLYVVTEVVASAESLATKNALPVDAVVSLGVELLGGLEALHAAGVTLGGLEARDVLLDPAVLDVSLAGLRPGGSPEADVRALAELLNTAATGGHEHGLFEATLRSALQAEVSASGLREALSQLKERWSSRTAVSSGKKSSDTVEVVEPDLSGVTLGQYKLERVLGEGAMGRVYLAKHHRIGRLAALKVLKSEHARNSELVQRFIQEAQAVNAIRNEHIVEVYDFGEQLLEDGSTCVFCVMELLDGRPLDAAMKLGPFSIQRATRIALNMASALHAAHQVGVVHRDVKPENIYLQKRAGDDEFVKVLDFGVAKLLKPIGDLPRSGTQAGIVIGTPEYMAPEQALGNPTDRRVDLYAVGLVLYEMLCGEQPFRADTFGKLVVEITSKPPPPLPATTPLGEPISAALVSAVMRCLAKDPDARFQTGEELAHTLAPFASGQMSNDDQLAGRTTMVPKVLLGIGVSIALVVAAVMVLRIGPPVVRVADPASEPTVVVEAAVPPPVPAPIDVKPEAIALVKLEVDTVPTGAKVIRVDSNELLGTTPLAAQLAPVAALSLRFEREGSQSVQREVALSSNVVLTVDLPPLPKQDAPVSVPKKKAEKKKVTHDGVVDPFE